MSLERRDAAAGRPGQEPAELLELFVPGRLCLLGEHSDWAGEYRSLDSRLTPGRCLVTGTDQGLWATAETADELVISSVLPDGSRKGPCRFALEEATLDRAAKERGFFSYATGVAAEVAARFASGGLRLEITRADLPVGKGLSSSAAVCVLVARAFDRIHRLGLSLRDEMELAYAGERRAGSACGRMDQICALGRRSALLTFDGEAFEVEALAPGGRLCLLVVDLGGVKDTRRILTDLRACFPATQGTVGENVRRALGPLNAALVERAREALVAGDAHALGALMTEAQAVFDGLVAPACPELSAPRLHRVLSHPAVRDLAWGGKGVGSQGDGCAQLVARGEGERAELSHRIESDLGMRVLPLTLDPVPGAASSSGEKQG
jgi:galactokinase